MKSLFSPISNSIRIVLLSVVCLSITSTHADYVTVYPSSEGNYTAWTANISDKIDAVHNNDGNTSYITTNHIGDAQTFSFSSPSLPTGTVINSLHFYMYARKVDVGYNDQPILPENNPRASFRFENSPDATDISDIGDITLNNDDYQLFGHYAGTNPVTGNAWTLEDVNTWSTRFGVVRLNEGSETGVEPRITKLWVDVDYTLSTATSTEGGSGGEGSGGGSGGGSATTTATTTNTLPVANPQSITTAVNTQASTTLTATDVDVPAQVLVYLIATTTTNGTTTLSGTSTVVYTPNTDFVGTDSFTFVVFDGVATSTPATVTITVGSTSGSGGSGGGSGGGGGGSSGGGGGGSSVSSGGGYFVGGGSSSGGQVLGANTSGSGGGNGVVLGASSTCGLYITKYTRAGYDNDTDTVRKIQTFLNAYLKAPLPVTGYYGPLTEKYIKELQTKHKNVMLDPWNVTTPTGISYLTTVVGINNIVCPSLNLPIPTDLVVWSKHPDTPKR